MYKMQEQTKWKYRQNANNGIMKEHNFNMNKLYH